MTRAALWVGDSFTAGEGAGVPAPLTYPYLVGEQLGWSSHVDAQAGTGFVNDGFAASPGYAPLIRRLPTDAREVTPDVVVVDAGRNDIDAGPDVLERAVSDYLLAVRSAYPDADLVVVLPSLVAERQPPEYLRVADVLRRQAEAHGATTVDPAVDGPFADRDLNQVLVCDDGFHPSARGQARYAEVLAPLLREALA
jgi:lysophospholipase L1-like esterase